MDPHLLLECFSATLQGNQEIRLHAETQLRDLTLQPGFLGACLDIISSEDSQQIPHGVKLATGVYFKNRIVRFWNENSPEQLRIDHDEKPYIRSRILSVLVKSDYNTKQQLIPALRTMIANDFIKWNKLLSETGNLLQSIPSVVTKDEDLSSLYTGLLCFAEISRTFRWVENDSRSEKLYPMINLAFPHLLAVGNSLISCDNNNFTELMAECLKLILKIFKYVTYYDFPEPLRQPESFSHWLKFHQSVLNLPTPKYIGDTLSEQEKSFFQISKCYKWSIANIFRIFTRYGYSNSLSKKFKYKEFQKYFGAEISSGLINYYFSIVEQLCNKTKWISSQAIYYLLELFAQCIINKQTWQFIKPYYDTLIRYFIYPILCPDDTSLELFDTDPHEYISIYFDINDEFDSPDIAALGFLVTLLHKRSQTTLETIVNMIYQELNELQQQEETLQVAKRKEGMLRIVANVAPYLINPATNDINQLQNFLSALVIPNLNSKYEFLCARTLDVLNNFSDISFTNLDPLIIYQGIITNFNEKDNLVIKFESALSIRAYLSHDQFKSILSTMIIPVMSKLLYLSNEIDNDAIAVVMQECVESFSEQLQPFGVELMTKIVEQLLRLVTEINEMNQNENYDEDDEDNNAQSDKIMAAIGLLNTMITVLLSFENSQETCLKLEEIFEPVIQYVLINKLDDFLSEIGELIENTTFLLRSISPAMWRIFELLYSSFMEPNGGGIVMMYIEELIPSLQNYLLYGIWNEEGLSHCQQLFQIINQIFAYGDGMGEIRFGCELGQTFILTYGTKNPEYVVKLTENFVKLYQVSIKKDSSSQKLGNAVNLINMIVASISIDPTGTTRILNEQQDLDFFDRWFNKIPQLNRVYDLKLSIIGTIYLMGSGFDQLLNKLGIQLAILFKKLPVAMAALERKRKNYSSFEGQRDLVDASNVHDEQEETQQQEVGPNEYLNFLQQEDNKIKNLDYYEDEEDEEEGEFDDDDDMVEDPLISNPLDNVDVMSVAKNYLQELHRTDITRFELIFNTIPVQDRHIIESLID
ncbi:armadillo-type protein [Scheffersomyces amazonensis]|uniref:armadillo-type protein n=1 Tax=Scheffersomyces amazonensis TaxID=1078765 RepID=UPI00315D4A5F